MTRDVELAEDLAQDALVAALEQWPATGVPEKPIAWLMTTAKRRGIDHFRRADKLRRKLAELEHAGEGEEEGMPDLDGQVDYIEDDVLRLIFLSCHPSLTAESRAALTLRLVGGLTTAEIARGFLVAESTMGQRISRAKKTLSAAQRVRAAHRSGADQTSRRRDGRDLPDLQRGLHSHRWRGLDASRPGERGDAARAHARRPRPDEPEVLGLQALLEIQGSRMAARLDEHGEPVLLEAQDRTRWDRVLIRRGLAALQQAELLAARGKPVGKYFLQASIAAQHARASVPRTRTGAGSRLLRRPGRRRAGTGRRGEPGGRARAGVRPGRGACGAGRGGRRGARRLAARAERARRPARTGRAARAGGRGVHRGGRRTRNEGERAVLRRRAEANLTRASKSR